MSFEKIRDPEQRARLKEARRVANAKRREKLARDPRVVATREAQRERRRQAYQAMKARRKEIARERTERQRQGAAEERGRRDAAILGRLRPAAVAEKAEAEAPSPVSVRSNLVAFPTPASATPPRRSDPDDD